MDVLLVIRPNSLVFVQGPQEFHYSIVLYDVGRERWPARQFRLQLFHLERVYVLDNVRDLQRAIFVFRKVEEEQDSLGKWIGWEDKGGICLPSRRFG